MAIRSPPLGVIVATVATVRAVLLPPPAVRAATGVTAGLGAGKLLPVSLLIGVIGSAVLIAGYEPAAAVAKGEMVEGSGHGARTEVTLYLLLPGALEADFTGPSKQLLLRIFFTGLGRVQPLLTDWLMLMPLSLLREMEPATLLEQLFVRRKKLNINALSKPPPHLLLGFSVEEAVVEGGGGGATAAAFDTWGSTA
jgi:hypothetical protein